ncbi:hypothetical protein PVK06_010920 [Gossypium arboreum]|uniref:Uncharacterized protein n=1 Tax=Gossypium arboreum TaxID=29729 RepID=A0ABR0Q898_GOSAR|nr:hypothetical protein PVK06_010920 [Gossypium arboreum]
MVEFDLSQLVFDEVVRHAKKWLEGKHISTDPTNQHDEASKVAVEMPTFAGTLRNPVGFNRIMIDHLSSSIESHNRVIIKLRTEILVI